MVTFCTGLSHEDNIHKMRVLTFVQIAEGKSELSFDNIEKELQLEPDDVQPFVIDGELLLLLLLLITIDRFRPVSRRLSRPRRPRFM